MDTWFLPKNGIESIRNRNVYKTRNLWVVKIHKNKDDMRILNVKSVEKWLYKLKM